MNNLKLAKPAQTATTIIEFLRQTFKTQRKTKAVLAVSGGLDSAVVLKLLSQAIPKHQIFPLLLPYDDQDMSDARLAIESAQLPSENVKLINIRPVVEAFVQLLLEGNVEPEDQVRHGNLMVRVRMSVIYDYAQAINALVVGTENKSERQLGYFTRFGDEASDLEPLAQLYKTQVRELAQHLEIPLAIQVKPPSAGLWDDQTDELEFGFSYEVADQVMLQLIDQKIKPSAITIPGVESGVIKKVLRRIERYQFKQWVPYKIRG